MTPAEYYSTKTCPFCNHQLSEVIDDQGMIVETICHFNKCDTQYIYDVVGDSVSFILGDYSFSICREDNFTSIVENYHESKGYDSWKEIMIQESIIVTKDNYQRHVDRFNKLKSFA